jgi:glycosyltransferase involved in cell wall biosynthesis
MSDIGSPPRDAHRLAVLVPCLNEAADVGTVVRDFRAALPSATVYVYDNGSTDGTGARAAEAGAVVRQEARPGKGNVVRRMFADIEADVYVLVDGDGTYDAAAAPGMIQRLYAESLDMVIGRRVTEAGGAFPVGHVAGNRFFNRLYQILFGSVFQDVLSGYRVMSRRLVKSFPTMVDGFEIETELTAHAVEIKAPCVEIETVYVPRGTDSESKLRTYRDGLKILGRALLLYKELRPARFFGSFSIVFGLAGVVLAIPVFEDYAHPGLVPRLPSAVLATALELLAFLFLTAGLILSSLARRHQEIKRLHYLGYPAPGDGDR